MVNDPVISERLYWVFGRTNHHQSIELIEVAEIFRAGYVRVESKILPAGPDFLARQRNLFRHRDDAEIFATCQLLGAEL